MVHADPYIRLAARLNNALVFLFVLSSTSGYSNPSAFVPFQPGRQPAASEYRDAASGLDTSKPLRWSYYFSARDPKHFSTTVASLKTKRYVVVSERADAQGNYLLQLARVEIHSVNSLALRNEALFGLADNQGIIYEGWSVDGKTTN